MTYLDNLTEDQRDILLKPSKALTAFKTFTVDYRKIHPKASMNQVQDAYQRHINSGLEK